MATRSDIRAGRAYVELFLKKSELEKGLKGIRAQAQKLSDEFLKLGKAIGKFAIAAAIPIALATKRFMDFDDQMRIVKAVSQSTNVEFLKLSETAKRLGRTSGVTAVDVAKIMAELGRAGFAASQVDIMTESVIALARASNTEAAVAAGIMASTIRQFGLGAGDAARVADVLTHAANATFNSVTSLGEALSYAGPVAADFGLSLEDALALLGTLGDMGIQGSEGGTAIRRLLTLSAAEAKAWGDSFGVVTTDAQNNVRPLIDVLEDIRTATAGMGSADRGAKMKEAFGILGITAASALGKSAVGVRELRDELEAASGIARATAKEMDAGLGGSMRRLIGVVEGIAIAFGEALAPVLMTIADSLEFVGGLVIRFLQENRQVAIVITGVVAGLLALSGILITTGVGFGVIAFAIGGFLGAIVFVKAVLAGIVGLLAAVLSPIGLLTVAIVGGAAAFLYYSGAAKAALDWLVSVVKPYTDVIIMAFGGISAALQKGDLALAASIAMNGVLLAFEMVKLQLIQSWISWRDWFLGLWDSLRPEISATLAYIGSLWGSLVEAFVQTDLWLGLVEGWNIFSQAASSALNFVVKWGRFAISVLNELRKELTKTATAAVTVAAAIDVSKMREIEKRQNVKGLGHILGDANDAAAKARENAVVDRGDGDQFRIGQQQEIVDEQRKLLEAQVKQAKADLEIAQQNLLDKGPGAPAGGGPPKIPGAPEVIEEVKAKTFGTFSAAALLGQTFGAKGGAKKLEEIGERQIKVVEKIDLAQAVRDEKMIKALEIPVFGNR